MLAHGPIVTIDQIPTKDLLLWLSDRLVEPGEKQLEQITHEVKEELRLRKVDIEMVLGPMRNMTRQQRLAKIFGVNEK